MANKPKIISYKGKALYTNSKDSVIRVSFDKTNGTYWLYKDSKRITSRTNKDDPDKAQKDIAIEFYKIVEKSNTVKVEQHHIQPQTKQKLKVTWLYIFDNKKKIQDYLLNFYGEEGYLEAEDEEPITFEDMLEEDYDCQAVYRWDQILQARKYIKEEDKNYEPMIWNVDGGECYIIYNGIVPKEIILKDICTQLNNIYQFVNQQNREELKDSLFASGVVTPDRLKEGKSYWGDVWVISEDELDGYYQNIIYATDGESISIMQNTVDKEFIVKQFAKLFKEDQHSTATLAGMPELLNIPQEQPKKSNNEKVKRYTFDDILNAYKNKAQSPPSSKSIKDADNWLNEFISICSAKANKRIRYADEITDEQLDSYTIEICKVATQPKYKYKASWLSKKQVEYLERQKKYPKPHWQRNRIRMLMNLLTNAINELIPTSTAEERAPIDRILFHLKRAKLIDKTQH